MGFRIRKENNDPGSGTVVAGVLRSYSPAYPALSTLLSSIEQSVPARAAGFSVAECTDSTNRRVGGHYISGGYLSIRKNALSSSSMGVSLVHDFAGGQRYDGQVFPLISGGIPGPISAPNLPTAASGNIESYGASGWNKFKPGRPATSLTVFLGELRDMPRMVLDLKARARAMYVNSPKRLGQDYLAANFGWLPLASDLRRMYGLYRHSEKILSELERNNGQWTQRGGTVFETSTASTVEKIGLTNAAFAPKYTYFTRSSPIPRSFTTSETGRKVWFSGRFRYYIPERNFKDSAWRRKTIRRMYGLTLTPADIWELTPWSWLIDYFSNAGDVLSNLSTGVVDDVVAKYAYIMGTTTVRTTTTTSALLKNIEAGDVYFSGTAIQESCIKNRNVATPFGFGMSSEDFSGRQLAILTALGLSKT